MKKRKFLLGLILSSMLLTGCNGASSDNLSGKGYEEISYSSSSLLNEELIATNGLKVDYSLYEKTKTPSYQYRNHDYDDITTYASSGLIITKSGSKIGFYSLLHQKYLIGESYEAEWLKYQVIPNVSGLGFLLIIKYENKLDIYDGFFNHLYFEDDYTASLPSVTYEPRVIKDGFEFKLEFGFHEMYFSYDETGKSTEIMGFSENNEEETNDNEDDYDGPTVGDIFQKGWIDLSSFGLENYSLYISSKNMVSTFYEDKPVCSFNIEANLNEVVIVGENLIYQKKSSLPDDTQIYQYFSKGVKYSLETVSVNLKTAKTVTRNFKFVIDNVEYLLDNDEKVSCYSLTYRPITDYRILGDTKTNIVDNSFIFYDDITKVDISSTYKLPNGNYYDATNYVLYNSDFEVVANLEKAKPYFNSKVKVFVGTVNGKVGLISMDGVVHTKFEYDHIYVDDGEEDASGCLFFLGVKGNKLFRIYFDDCDEEEIGYNVNKYSENLFGYYRYEDSQKITLCSSQNYLTSFYSELDTFYRVIYLGQHSVVYIIPDQFSDSNYKTIKYSEFKLADYVSISSDFIIHEIGDKLDDPVLLLEGSNDIHLNNSGVLYAKFEPQETANYHFTFSKHSFTWDVYELIFASLEPIYSLDSNTSSSIHVGLYQNKTYIIKMCGTFNDQLDTITVTKDYGLTSSTPLLYHENDNGYFLIPVTEGIYNKIYVSFTSNESGYYIVQGHSENTVSISSVTLSNVNVTTKGFDAPVGRAITLEITFTTNLVEGQKIRMYKDDSLVPSGTSESTAMDVYYGVSAQLSIQSSSLSSYGYFRYIAKASGNYSFSYSYNYSSSTLVYFLLYSSSGTLKNSQSITTRNTTKTISMEENDYVICKYTLASSTYTASLTVSSTSGEAYENPKVIEAGNAYTTTSTYNYYSLTGEAGEYRLDLSKTGSGTFYLMNEEGTNELNTGDTITLTNEALFIMVYTSSTVTFTINLFLPESSVASEVLTLENVIDVDFSSSGVHYYNFTNETENTLEVQLQVSEGIVCNHSFYGYYSTDSLVAGEDNNIVSLQSNETVYFTIMGTSDIENPKIKLSENIIYPNPYVISLTTTYDNYAWTENSGVYTSSNKGVSNSTSSLVITFYQAGTFSFNYMSYGENSYDYLILYVNGSKPSNWDIKSSSSFYTYSLSVQVGDVLRFSYKKDGSVDNNYDYAQIKNLTFVKA